MAKSKKKPLKTKADKKVTKKEPNKQVESEDDEFDFGGIPKGIDLKKNIGCGG